MSMPNIRGHLPQSKFADAARQARGVSTMGARYKRPEGLYDRLKLGASPIWVRMSPDQAYAQMLYNKELKQVIETGTPEHEARPWFEHINHFVVVKKRPMLCSSAADRQQPCRGCAIRAHYFEQVRAREHATGTKDNDAGKKAPVQSATRYAMAVTVLEKVLVMPLLDKSGKPRKNKNGDVLTNFIPAPLSGLNPMKQKEAGGEFARNMHWAFGPQHLSHLASIDTDLWNSCANCASPLLATCFNCADCGKAVYTDENGVAGADLRNMREQSLRCPHCMHEGITVPEISCTGCEAPREGNLLCFDLRLRLEIDPGDDKKSVVQMVQFRLPDYAKLYDRETSSRVFDLVHAKPLDIAAIYAPDSIDAQAWVLPDDLKNVDPSYHLAEKEAQPYGMVPPLEGREDPDQMNFDE